MLRPSGHRAPSVLDQMDGSSAPEELAGFVGQAYDRYLQPAAAGGGSLADADSRQKLDFLRAEGFISDAVHKRLTAGGR